ncbi:ABC transporter ATP-binding protein [Paracoccus sp. p4-l81]|uniref:ABC transporter ATP-binding protein n=1 Tax=Paracoccus sp. p4-l81 TaxID=3342806 RepID=UPI0035BB16F2
MLRDFWGYYRPHMGLFLLDFGCAILSGLLELAFPLAVTAFIDRLLPQGDWALTLAAAGGLLALYALNAALLSVVIYWGHKLGINIETRMRARAFDHLTRLSWRWHDRARTGKLVARVTRDLEDIGEVAHHGPEDAFIAVMTFVGAFVLMFRVQPSLALIVALIVPAMMALVIVYGGRMTATWRAIFGRVGDFNVRLDEALGGVRVVQAFGNETHEAELFARDNARYRDAKLRAYRVMAVSSTLQYLGLRFVQVIVMVVGAWFVLEGRLTTGGFVGFLLLVGVFYRPLEKIAAVIETYPKGIAGFRRYRDLLATPVEIADAPGAVAPPVRPAVLQFESVGFAYDPARPILDDVSLTVRAGETVAFVGPSGAGKTTLLALVPRFYDPTAGRITLDGTDLRDLRLSGLRQLIGLVGQDVFLFGGSLRENIAYGRIGATEDEIRAAADQARLGDLIDSLPQGLDSTVGERGVMLSGGQKQRVAIARAFLKNPPILILDEATSALDTQTERDIQDALDHLSQGRTTLVIAHRLATIRNADRIVVMDGGRIVEAGTHAELLARQGRYAGLAAQG